MRFLKSSLWTSSLFAAGFLAAALLPAPVSAQSTLDPDLEDDPDNADLIKTPTGPTETLREVVRGTYLQAVPGGLDFLGVVSDPTGQTYPFGAGVYWGTVFRFNGGIELIPEGPFAFGVEASIWESINGAEDGTLYPGTPIIVTQGSTRTTVLEAAVRPALMFGPSGRFALYGRVGGGVSLFHGMRDDLPLGSADTLYSSATYGYKPKPTITLGSGLEYYTRLSHFSFTFLEVTALYVVGVDWGLSVNAAGFKYTF